MQTAARTQREHVSSTRISSASPWLTERDTLCPRVPLCCQRPARQLRRSRPRTAALHIKMGEGDDQEDVLHTFFQFDDGSCIAFFDAPDRPFDWKEHLVSFYKTLFYSLFIHLQGLLSSSSITFGCFFFSLFSAHFSVACGPYCRLTAGSSHCF